MKTLNLRSQLKTETLAVPVEFIDTFMPAASGEAVKVYLYLLRASQAPGAPLSLSEIANIFDLTEKKLSQTLLYWEDCGLLNISRDGEGISGLELLKPGRAENTQREEPVRETEEYAPEEIYSGPVIVPAPRPMNIHDLDEDEAFSELLALTEYYLKRPITSTQRESLGRCYLLLGRQADAVEYLLEYCIEQGHTSFHYIESVAEGWNREGLRSPAEIKEATADRNRAAYSVKKAFGITQRALVKEETAYVEKWTKKFDMELILEACGRTMAAIHNPSFQYADRILSAWEEKSVRSLSDVEAVDRERKAKAAASASDSGNASAKGRNTFRNFTERATDYSALIPDYYEG